ncbi:MAG: long-chain-acyl-CoA synthetase, partial [Maricaulaceae bacterium]
LFEHVSTSLPPFARSVFLRLHEEYETTVTFKYRKMDLVADGFDPDKVQEPLYVADPQAGTFVPLDAAKRQAILDGELRL